MPRTTVEKAFAAKMSLSKIIGPEYGFTSPWFRSIGILGDKKGYCVKVVVRNPEDIVQVPPEIDGVEVFVEAVG